jgi:hypothetical protein
VQELSVHSLHLIRLVLGTALDAQHDLVAGQHTLVQEVAPVRQSPWLRQPAEQILVSLRNESAVLAERRWRPGGQQTEDRQSCLRADVDLAVDDGGNRKLHRLGQLVAATRLIAVVEFRAQIGGIVGP